MFPAVEIELLTGRGGLRLRFGGGEARALKDANGCFLLRRGIVRMHAARNGGKERQFAEFHRKVLIPESVRL
jgi:hypothetical protein